jgi:transposase
MPREPLHMHKIEAILKERQQGLSIREIAAALSLKTSTVNDYIQRAQRANISYPLAEDLSDEEIRDRLLNKAGDAKPLPLWTKVHGELRRKGVTLQLLHEEYLGKHPKGYQYSQFCRLYRGFKKSLELSMRQTHTPGEKMFVDFAGQTVPIIDGARHEVLRAAVFVAVLGASNYAFAQVLESQRLPAWIDAHVKAFEYFGGASALLVPDNLKSAVTKPDYYEPDVNATYEEMAAHYGASVLPARPLKPKDKAKAEGTVLGVSQRILAPLRDRTFFTLAEANDAIAEQLILFNDRPFQKLPGSRKEMFEAIEMAELQPLPCSRYEMAEFRRGKANIDYHLTVRLGPKSYRYYSVPYAFRGCELRVRLTQHTVEIFFDRKRLATHLRVDKPGTSTLPEHMPRSHQRYVEWTPSRIREWAGKTGPACRDLAQVIMDSKPHPEHGFRSCMGLVSLAKSYGDDRLDAACQRALSLGLHSYRNVRNLLESGQDRLPLPEDTQPELLPINTPSHIRGAEYYK